MFESIFGSKKNIEKEPSMKEALVEAGKHGKKSWEHLKSLGQKIKDNPEEVEYLLDTGAQLWSLFNKKGEIAGTIKEGWEKIKSDPVNYRFHGAESLLKVDEIIEGIELDKQRKKVEAQSRTLTGIIDLGASMEEEKRLREMGEALEASIKDELDNLLRSLAGDLSEEEVNRKMARIIELKKRIAEISKNKMAKGQEAGRTFVEAKLEELRS